MKTEGDPTFFRIILNFVTILRAPTRNGAGCRVGNLDGASFLSYPRSTHVDDSEFLTSYLWIVTSDIEMAPILSSHKDDMILRIFCTIILFSPSSSCSLYISSPVIYFISYTQIRNFYIFSRLYYTIVFFLYYFIFFAQIYS